MVPYSKCNRSARILLRSLCTQTCMDKFTLLFNWEPTRANGRATCVDWVWECGYVYVLEGANIISNAYENMIDLSVPVNLTNI